MKKTLLATGVTLALGLSTSASAGFFAANSTYTVNVSGGCFAFGDCVSQGLSNVGTGSFTITTDATGDAFSVGNYSGINFSNTPGGLFQTGGPVAGSGSMTGNQMDLDFTGRTGVAQYFPQYAGAAWNLDNNTKTGFATGAYEGFTTGSDSNFAPDGSGTNPQTLTGTGLFATASGWTGTLVSVGNVGAQWTSFDGTPYTEVYNISVSQVPVPAAVWLMGSGLIGLVGVARRRKSA